MDHCSSHEGFFRGGREAPVAFFSLLVVVIRLVVRLEEKSEGVLLFLKKMFFSPL